MQYPRIGWFSLLDSLIGLAFRIHRSYRDMRISAQTLYAPMIRVRFDFHSPATNSSLRYTNIDEHPCRPGVRPNKTVPGLCSQTAAEHIRLPLAAFM